MKIKLKNRYDLMSGITLVIGIVFFIITTLHLRQNVIISIDRNTSNINAMITDAMDQLTMKSLKAGDITSFNVKTKELYFCINGEEIWKEVEEDVTNHWVTTVPMYDIRDTAIWTLKALDDEIQAEMKQDTGNSLRLALEERDSTGEVVHMYKNEEMKGGIISQMEREMGFLDKHQIKATYVVPFGMVWKDIGETSILWIIALILLEYSLYSIHHRFQMEKRNAQLRKLFMALYRHDMKMPIAAIVNRVFVLEEKGKEQRPGETQEELEGIKKAVKRLRDEVVELAAVQACEQDVKVDFEDVDINEVVRKVVEAAQPHEPGRKEPRVVMALKAENAMVRGNRELLQSIIQNLVDNALKYSPEETQVRVSSRETGKGMVEVEVADKGEGIAKGELRHIFRPRYRTKNAQKGKAGTGMGLFLAYANTKMHGGDIGVESELGKGSRFHVELPLKRMA